MTCRRPPADQALLDTIARAEFWRALSAMGSFDWKAGICVDEVSPVDERQLRNPHVAYFVNANPGHVRGGRARLHHVDRRDQLHESGQQGARPALLPLMLIASTLANFAWVASARGGLESTSAPALARPGAGSKGRTFQH